MATSKAFNAKLEDVVRDLLRLEYPHTKTSSINEIASSTAEHMAFMAQRQFKKDCKGVRKIDFLELPAELRNRIYEYAVCPSDGTPIEVGGLWFPSAIERARQPPPITMVSRQLRRETLSLYYSLNKFVVTSDMFQARWTRLAKWLHAIGCHNIEHIESFTVEVSRLFRYNDQNDFEQRENIKLPANTCVVEMKRIGDYGQSNGIKALEGQLRDLRDPEQMWRKNSASCEENAIQDTKSRHDTTIRTAAVTTR